MNTAETPLCFKLGTQLPFSVVKPQTGDGLVLQPQHSMQVRWGEWIHIQLLFFYEGHFDLSCCFFFSWMLGETGFPLFPTSSGPPDRGERLSWSKADPYWERSEEAEVPAEPPDPLQQRQPAGHTTPQMSVSCALLQNTCPFFIFFFFIADSASMCLPGCAHSESLCWLPQLWVLLHRANANQRNKPLQPWSPHLLENTD